MPVKESEFSLSQLWPKSSHNWMHPTAAASLASFPPGLDLGALRVNNGIWEIFQGRVPTSSNPLSHEWVPFEPGNLNHWYAANAFNRVGRGWSFGPAHGMHDEARGYFQDVHGRNPTDMEKLDIEHDRALWQDLLRKWEAKTGGPGPRPEPDRPQPPRPEPPVGGLPPLSAPEQRAAELMSLIPQYLQRSWMTPLVIEAVKAGRRAQDRVVQRVIAGLKEGK